MNIFMSVALTEEMNCRDKMAESNVIPMKNLEELSSISSGGRRVVTKEFQSFKTLYGFVETSNL